jgi:hypothetical protein
MRDASGTGESVGGDVAAFEGAVEAPPHPTLSNTTPINAPCQDMAAEF